MKYFVKIELQERQEPEPGRYVDDEFSAKLGIKKLVEATDEKAAIQKVVALLSKGEK